MWMWTLKAGYQKWLPEKNALVGTTQAEPAELGPGHPCPTGASPGGLSGDLVNDNYSPHLLWKNVHTKTDEGEKLWARTSFHVNFCVRMKLKRLAGFIYRLLPGTNSDVPAQHRTPCSGLDTVAVALWLSADIVWWEAMGQPHSAVQAGVLQALWNDVGALVENPFASRIIRSQDPVSLTFPTQGLGRKFMLRWLIDYQTVRDGWARTIKAVVQDWVP